MTDVSLKSCFATLVAGTGCDLQAQVAPYVLDNSSGTCVISITGTNNAFRMEPGAVIQSTTASNGAMRFVGASGMLFDGITYSYSPCVWTRQSPVSFEITGSYNFTVRHFTSRYTPSAALWISNSTNFVVDDVNIAYSGADGLHLQNPTNGAVNNVHIEETNDDGFAITNETKYPFGDGRRYRMFR